MDYTKVTYSLADGVARIGLNDQAQLNAVTDEMGVQLLHAVNRAEHEAKCVVVTGEGRAFCSGASLSDAFDVSDPARDAGALLENWMNAVISALKTMPIPVITAVRGAAAGFGCGLAVAGDLIVCSENAYFLQAFRHVGLSPDGGSAYLLPRAIGRPRAMEMMLLGEKVPAATALEWGLVNRVVPDAEFDEAVMTLARQLAAGPYSLGVIKKLAWAALDTGIDGALALERDAQRRAGRSEDFQEGIAAFREKRKAEFKGR